MIKQRAYTPNPSLFEQVVFNSYFLVRFLLFPVVVAFSLIHYHMQPLVAWVAWMLVGTCGYATVNEVGWAKGFYMAVNVGYSIGWDFPHEISAGMKIFSTVYVLVGSSIVAISLASFASSIISASNEWYATALQERKLQSDDRMRRIRAWVRLNQAPLQLLAIWIMIIIALVAFSVVQIGWDYSQAVYFAVSSLSTGGLWAIPQDSPAWHFGVVAVLTAVGVPVTGLLIAHFARIGVSSGTVRKAHRRIAKKVTLKELEVMEKLGLVEGKSEISRAEYILLCAVRLDALTPDLIDFINYRFHALDTSGDGTLDYAEILNMPPEIIHAEKCSLSQIHKGYLQPGTAHVSF